MRFVTAFCASIVWVLFQMYVHILSQPLDIQHISPWSAFFLTVITGAGIYALWLKAYKDTNTRSMSHVFSLVSTLLFCLYVWLLPFYGPALYKEAVFKIQRLHVDAARCARLENGTPQDLSDKKDQDYLSFVCNDDYGNPTW